MKYIISGFPEMVLFSPGYAPISPGLPGPDNYQYNYRGPYQMHWLKKTIKHLPFLRLTMDVCRTFRSNFLSRNVFTPVCPGFQ